MTGPLDDLDRHVDEMERRLRETTERMTQARAVGETLQDVVGVADSEDGHVHAEWSGQGLTVLDINPRALRLAAADLADAVRQTVGDALADFQRATLAALRSSGLLAPPEQQQADLDRAVARLGAAQADFAASLRSAAAVVARPGGVRRPDA